MLRGRLAPGTREPQRLGAVEPEEHEPPSDPDPTAWQEVENLRRRVQKRGVYSPRSFKGNSGFLNGVWGDMFKRGESIVPEASKGILGFLKGVWGDIGQV